MSDKGFHVHRDEHGHIDSIYCGDRVILHLVPGSKKNEENAEKVAQVLEQAARRQFWEGIMSGRSRKQ